MPRRRKSKNLCNRKTAPFSVIQPEQQKKEKHSEYQTSNQLYRESTVVLSCNTFGPIALERTQTYLSRGSKRHAETQDGIGLDQSSSKKQYKLTNQLPNKDVQQINVNAQTTTQADDETLLNVIKSADLNQAFQLLKGNNHFSQNGLNRALISACRRGLKYLVQELVYLGANVQFKDTQGNTPLLICTENGFIDIVRFLLNKKADVNASNSVGDTALILSIRPAGSLEMVRVLLDQNGIDISHQNRDGYTALMKAVEVRDVDVIKILMDSYKNKQIIGLFKQVGKRQRSSLGPVEVNSNRMALEEIVDKCGLRNIYSILKLHIIKRVSLLDTAIQRHDMESLNILLNCHFVGKQDIQESFMNIFKNVNLEKVKTFTEMKILIIRKLLEYGAEVDASWDGGSTPLSVVVKMGDYDLVELLCQHLDQRTSGCGSEAMIAASTSGRCDLIKLLLKYKADINNNNYYPGSSLDCALSLGHLESAKLLVQHGAKMDIKSALQSAVTQQLPEYMNFVFENYQQEVISYATIFCYGLNKLLVSASKGGNLEIIGRLLDAGADVNDEMDGKTPLGESKDMDVARFLISRGANVNFVYDDTETLLLKICNDNCMSSSFCKELVKMLLENGASVNESGNEGKTPLMAAASRKENVAMLQILLDHGADINSQDKRGNTALMNAESCPLNESFLLEFHKEKNLSLNVQNNEGRTALTFAVMCCDPDRIKQLIDFGADVNIKDMNGNTPLLYALSSMYEENVTPFIKAGSDVNCQSNKGFSPLMMAAKNCWKDTIISLLDSGADVNAVMETDSTKTALSFLTDYRNHNFQCCLEAFLKKGASSSFTHEDFLHKMILTDRIDVIPALIERGLGPADVESKYVIVDNITHNEIPIVSPLFVALLVGNVAVARYFVGNLFLTNSDITSLPRNKILRQVLEKRQHHDCLNYLEELSSQPLSLFQLAFVTVSSAVSASPTRENRVNMLPLPQTMKDKLLFKSQEIQLNISTKDCVYFQLEKRINSFDIYGVDMYTGEGRTVLDVYPNYIMDDFYEHEYDSEMSEDFET